MSDLADLFPGFESRFVPTDQGRIFARAGGAGPPLLLLHGYPQTHVMWHRVVPKLAESHRVVLMDLRGYGWSTVPRSDPAHATYAKRAMAQDAIRVMESFGHLRFHLAGHDRGGRVGYRLALDHPGRLLSLTVLDIVPTDTMWTLIERPGSAIAPHWRVLAAPAPGPETMIARDPWGYQREKLEAWTMARDLAVFDRRALAHYRAFFSDPSRIHATCEDYRAGSTRDREADGADRAAGRTIAAPVLVLWGRVGIPAAGIAPLAAWSTFADEVEGEEIESGHFLPEEAPEATASAMLRFLGSRAGA